MNDVIIKTGKKYVRGIINVVHLPTNKLGSLLLRNKMVRQYLNQAYEELGTGFVDVFNTFFDKSGIRTSFAWHNKLAEREFSLPVYPELQRSWNNARLWRWAGSRAIRAFYEFYLSHKPQGTFFDIGANDGLHTYSFAASGYQCFCFEPQATCVDYIRRTCDLNGFAQIAVECAVVNDRNDEQVQFYVSDSSWFSSLVKENVEHFEAAKPIQIRTVALDPFCLANDLKPDLIKIDVEGCEWQVMQGGLNIFRQARPDFLIEIHSDKMNVQRFWELFSKLEYSVYFVHHYTPKPFKVMTSPEDCLAAIGHGRNGDFIALSNQELASDFEKALHILR